MVAAALEGVYAVMKGEYGVTTFMLPFHSVCKIFLTHIALFEPTNTLLKQASMHCFLQSVPFVVCRCSLSVQSVSLTLSTHPLLTLETGQAPLDAWYDGDDSKLRKIDNPHISNNAIKECVTHPNLAEAVVCAYTHLLPTAFAFQ